MTQKERNKLRRLQDRLIKKLERRGFTDKSIIITQGDLITLKDLREYIYPSWKAYFEHLLNKEGKK
jgi:hypothetical protein